MKKLIGCETLMSMVMLGMFFFANSRVSFGIAIIAAFFVATIVVVIVGFISSLGAAFIAILTGFITTFVAFLFVFFTISFFDGSTGVALVIYAISFGTLLIVLLISCVNTYDNQLKLRVYTSVLAEFLVIIIPILGNIVPLLDGTI